MYALYLRIYCIIAFANNFDICLCICVSRLIFLSSSSAREWVQKNKHFHLLSKGVEQDGWRFVLLARFSPVPSYVINYALAATKVRFLVDFLLPTIIGCLPMILQNTSLGSLAGAAVASASGSQKSRAGSYIFPVIGIMASVLISLRIKKYCKTISVESSAIESISNSENVGDSSQPLTSKGKDSIKKR